LQRYTIFYDDFFPGDGIKSFFLTLQELNGATLGEDLAEISLLLPALMTTFKSFLVFNEYLAVFIPSALLFSATLISS